MSQKKNDQKNFKFKILVKFLNIPRQNFIIDKDLKAKSICFHGRYSLMLNKNKQL